MYTTTDHIQKKKKRNQLINTPQFTSDKIYYTLQICTDGRVVSEIAEVFSVNFVCSLFLVKLSDKYNINDYNLLYLIKD